jgi:ketosteroid isomerase-like protein
LEGQRPKEIEMTVEEIARSYYEAWQERGGDFSEVPLAEDFEFRGPVASFTSAEGYRQMASQAGQAVTRFEVRRQFVDGNSVCSIVDWEMAIPGVGPLRAAELLEIADGKIVRGELFYDGEELRSAMGQGGG